MSAILKKGSIFGLNIRVFVKKKKKMGTNIGTDRHRGRQTDVGTDVGSERQS